jgi:hypothetical protein
LFLTERLGGNVLIAGTGEFGGVTFAITQELLDAVFSLTYTAVSDPGPVPPPAPPSADAQTKPEAKVP